MIIKCYNLKLFTINNFINFSFYFLNIYQCFRFTKTYNFGLLSKFIK